MLQSSFRVKMRIVLLQHRGADPDRAWDGAKREFEPIL